MPLNPTGSEIPRSLTDIGTTIDAALNLKVDSAAYQNAGGIDAGIWKEQLDLTGVNTGDQDLFSYATTSAVAAGYQPLDADLTAIAALTTTSTGRSLLTESTAQTGTGALVRAASPTLTGTLNAAAITASGAIATSVNGAASTPAVLLSGSWLSGGTGTTNKPQLLVEATGANSASWNTSGTGLGINCLSGFAGRFFDIQNNGSTVFLVNTVGVTMSGQIVAPSLIQMTSAGEFRFGAGGDAVISRPSSGVINTNASISCVGLTASGTLRVGGGTVVANILSATATLDFPSIGSNDTETLTITVTGAVAGDSVFLGCPAGLDAGLIFCASVTAANTVTVRMHNSSGGSIDPASGTFRATVIRF